MKLLILVCVLLTGVAAFNVAARAAEPAGFPAVGALLPGTCINEEQVYLAKDGG